MICQDTNGLTPIVHIPRETIELAQELQSVIGVIRTNGGGEGEIVVKVSSGKIGWLDFTMRRFLGRNKNTRRAS